jgi:hypothetical protein
MSDRIPITSQYECNYLNGMMLAGKQLVLTITEVFGKGSVKYDTGQINDKPVLAFAEIPLRYALPKKVLKQMVMVAAKQGKNLDLSDLRNLVGWRFIFYTELDKNPQFPGEKVPCVRVKLEVPPPVKAKE